MLLRLITTLVLTTASLFGEVVHAPNLEVIETKISELDERALVVFDVDFTLIVPKDQILQPAGEAYYQTFVKKLRSMGEEGTCLGSKIALQSEVVLVNPASLSLLDKLKKMHVKTITLTAMPTGQFGAITSAEDWRFKQLKDLGIDLSWSFPETPYLRLDHFEKSIPTFKNGILASAKASKGQVLIAFLTQMHVKPSQIIFIDDRMEYIESVESALEEAKIPHTSFHYSEALDRSESFNKEIADFQFEHLLHYGEWLNDSEVRNQSQRLSDKACKK